MFLTENHAMKKILPCMLLLILTGCAAGASSETGITAETQGVYYPAIPEKELKSVYRDMACYAYTLLRYDDEVYTSFYWNSLQGSTEIPLESVIGKEIGTVYGNHEVFWSADEKDLADSTLTASVYSV